MGNSQCQSKLCCKGESSPNEEIRLSSLDSASGRFHPSQRTESQLLPQLPSSSLLEPVSPPSKQLSSTSRPPLLELKVLSSNTLPNSSILKISPEGYEFSRREVRDGVTYFGWRKGKGERPEDASDVIMDVVDQDAPEKHRGRHFEVAYRPEKQSYWIKDLGVGFGAFLRLDEPYRLKDSTLLNIGESFVVVNLETASESRLKLKLFGGPCKGEVFYFLADDFQNSRIHIGRAPNSEVHIDDNLISKCHAYVYNESGNWFASDGDPEKRRNSTNGTWLYINDSTELREGQVFKANQTLFEVHLCNSY